MSSVMQLLGELTALLGTTDSIQLAEVDELGHRSQLELFAVTVRSKLAMIADAIAAESFTRLHSQHVMTGPIEHRQPLDPSGAAT